MRYTERERRENIDNIRHGIRLKGIAHLLQATFGAYTNLFVNFSKKYFQFRLIAHTNENVDLLCGI